jgi:hypothetical protein
MKLLNLIVSFVAFKKNEENNIFKLLKMTATKALKPQDTTAILKPCF